MRAALLMRTAQPDNATKLKIAISLMPQRQMVSVSAFMDEMTALRMNTMQRGQTALLAMTDEEWEGLFNG